MNKFFGRNDGAEFRGMTTEFRLQLRDFESHLNALNRLHGQMELFLKAGGVLAEVSVDLSDTINEHSVAKGSRNTRGTGGVPYGVTGGQVLFGDLAAAVNHLKGMNSHEIILSSISSKIKLMEEVLTQKDKWLSSYKDFQKAQNQLTQLIAKEDKMKDKMEKSRDNKSVRSDKSDGVSKAGMKLLNGAQKMINITNATVKRPRDKNTLIRKRSNFSGIGERLEKVTNAFTGPQSLEEIQASIKETKSEVEKRHNLAGKMHDEVLSAISGINQQTKKQGPMGLVQNELNAFRIAQFEFMLRSLSLIQEVNPVESKTFSFENQWRVFDLERREALDERRKAFLGEVAHDAHDAQGSRKKTILTNKLSVRASGVFKTMRKMSFHNTLRRKTRSPTSKSNQEGEVEGEKELESKSKTNEATKSIKKKRPASQRG